MFLPGRDREVLPCQLQLKIPPTRGITVRLDHSPHLHYKTHQVPPQSKFLTRLRYLSHFSLLMFSLPPTILKPSLDVTEKQSPENIPGWTDSSPRHSRWNTLRCVPQPSLGRWKTESSAFTLSAPPHFFLLKETVCCCRLWLFFLLPGPAGMRCDGGLRCGP